MRRIGIVVALCLASSLLTVWAVAPVAEEKSLLERHYGETAALLEKAGDLLNRARGGDTAAMYQLGKLFHLNQNQAEMWLYHGAIQGHEDAAVYLIRYYIRDPEPLSYRSGYAWLQTSWQLGYLGDEPVVLCSGSTGEHRHDESWFRERMTSEETSRALRLSDKFLRQIQSVPEG